MTEMAIRLEALTSAYLADACLRLQVPVSLSLTRMGCSFFLRHELPRSPTSLRASGIPSDARHWPIEE